MSTINERIKRLIEDREITKTAFAKKLNVTQAYISKLVKTGEPSIRLIDDICEKFNADREWLEKGVGGDEVVYNIRNEDKELADFVADLLIGKDEKAVIFLKKYMKLSDDMKKLYWEMQSIGSADINSEKQNNISC